MISFHFEFPGRYRKGTAIISAPLQESALNLLATKIGEERMAGVKSIGGVIPNPEMANMLYFDDGNPE